MVEGLGIGKRERWREYDGERSWGWRDEEGRPHAGHWTEYFALQMEWYRKEGVWYGRWAWQPYERDEVWDGFFNRQWVKGALGSGARRVAYAAPASGTMPQEVLLYLIREIKWVSPTL